MFSLLKDVIQSTFSKKFMIPLKKHLAVFSVEKLRTPLPIGGVDKDSTLFLSQKWQTFSINFVKTSSESSSESGGQTQ